MEEDDRSNDSTSSRTLESEQSPSRSHPQISSGTGAHAGSKPSFDQTEILRAVEVVERDSVAISESFASLFASLQLALTEVTSSSVDHMHCFSDASGRIQESVLDASTKGNNYISSCMRLNEEMKGIDGLARQLYPYMIIGMIAKKYPEKISEEERRRFRLCYKQAPLASMRLIISIHIRTQDLVVMLTSS